MLDKILTFVMGLDQNQMIMFSSFCLLLLYCVWKLLKPVFELPLKLIRKIPRPKSKFGLTIWYLFWIIWWVPVTPIAVAGYTVYKNPDVVQEYYDKAVATVDYYKAMKK